MNQAEYQQNMNAEYHSGYAQGYDDARRWIEPEMQYIVEVLAEIKHQEVMDLVDRINDLMNLWYERTEALNKDADEMVVIPTDFTEHI